MKEPIKRNGFGSDLFYSLRLMPRGIYLRA